MVRPDGSDINSIGMNMLRMTNRFSWDETVTRGVFEKLYVATKYPIIIVDLFPQGNRRERVFLLPCRGQHQL